MKEENKYYIPEISEFHIGFEYEMWETHSMLYDRTIDDSKWVKKKHDARSISLDKLNCRLKDCRVKHLDEEDIESLGWKDGELMGLGGFTYNWNTEDNFQMYLGDDGFIQIYNWNSEFVFQGTIKNKSELQKLMSQLNIK